MCDWTMNGQHESGCDFDEHEWSTGLTTGQALCQPGSHFCTRCVMALEVHSCTDSTEEDEMRDLDDWDVLDLDYWGPEDDDWDDDDEERGR